MLQGCTAFRGPGIWRESIDKHLHACPDLKSFGPQALVQTIASQKLQADCIKQSHKVRQLSTLTSQHSISAQSVEHSLTPSAFLLIVKQDTAERDLLCQASFKADRCLMVPCMLWRCTCQTRTLFRRLRPLAYCPTFRPTLGWTLCSPHCAALQTLTPQDPSLFQRQPTALRFTAWVDVTAPAFSMTILLKGVLPTLRHARTGEALALCVQCVGGLEAAASCNCRACLSAWAEVALPAISMQSLCSPC